MIYYVLLAVSILLAVVKSALYNTYAKNEKPGIRSIFRFNMISYGIAAIVSLLFGIGNALSAETILWAVIYAVTVCSLQGLTVLAMKMGSMSATSLMSLYGMIIPAIAGPIFWHEPFGILQGVGILLVLFSMWLLNAEETRTQTTHSLWGIWVMLVFVLSGLAGVIEKIHQSTDGRNEKAMFLFVAYLIMFCISCVGLRITKKEKSQISPMRSVLTCGGISGIIIGFYAFINLTLAGKLNSMLYYPVANGGALLFTVLLSVTIFREKCTKRQIEGFIIGFLSIIILSLPI